MRMSIKMKIKNPLVQNCVTLATVANGQIRRMLI